MTTISTKATSVRPSLMARLRNAHQRRKAYFKLHNELCSLSKRELNDIGIAPGQIHEIARQHALETVPAL